MSRSSSDSLPRLAITTGDLTGIGPEIIARALSQSSLSSAFKAVILGDAGVLNDAFQRWGNGVRLDPVQRPTRSGLALPSVQARAPLSGAPTEAYPGSDRSSPQLGDPLPEAPTELPSPEERPSLQVWDPLPDAPPEDQPLPEMVYIRAAAEGCLAGEFDAMVTAPICKESMYRRGFPFPGHTEYLAHVTGSTNPIMSFAAPGLRVSLVTVYIPLRRVFETLTPERILDTIRTSAHGLRTLFGISEPRLAVCGLNPHAGEQGHLGDEEETLIAPAIARARAEGLQVEGPLPADTVFVQAARGKFDLVVAHYHDQGLIPVKLLSFGESVNLTLGLPIIRTSVDHGVAYDIAGRGIADASSMSAAIRLALQIVQQRRAQPAAL